MWALDINKGEAWETICQKKSATLCKRAARAIHKKSGFYSGTMYRVYDQRGILRFWSCGTEQRMVWNKSGIPMTRELLGSSFQL